MKAQSSSNIIQCHCDVGREQALEQLGGPSTWKLGASAAHVIELVGGISLHIISCYHNYTYDYS